MTLIVIAGQSNALGYGNTAPPPMTPTPKVQIWDQDHFEMMEPGVNTGTPANPTVWGPELSMAVWYHLSHPDDTLYIVKSVKGQTGIANDPGELDWSPHSHELFDTTTQEINEAEAAIGDTVDAIFWMQGEQDALSATKAASYGSNLGDLFWNMRNVWGDLGTPIYYGRISADLAYSDTVRAGQESQDNFAYHMVDTDALTTSDGIHFDKDGQIGLGNQFYDEWIGF